MLADHPNGYEAHLASVPVRVPRTTEQDVLTPTSLAADLLTQPGLLVGRQLEMLNVLLGFEQANKYSIKNMAGVDVGYIAEEDTLVSTVSRQLLRNNRPFKASILDARGQEVLRLSRPFTLINSCVTVRDEQGRVIGEVRQVWHLWRRKYELFVGKKQFAAIDTGFLGWDFRAVGEEGQVLAAVNRNFTGFAREIFTDMGSYALYMDALAVAEQRDGYPLSRDERAVLLACAICIDMDYFSRHSGSGGLLGGGGGGFFPLWGMGGSGGSNDGSGAPLGESDISQVERESSWGGLFGGDQQSEEGGSSSPWGIFWGDED